MKAVILTEPGGTENLSLRDIETPQPKDGELLIEVYSISINPVDIKTRKGGALYASMKESGPVILGWDVAGKVAAVGAGVSNFKTGDAVFGMVNFPGHGRAYAEYLTAPASHFAAMPVNVSFEEAAAATLAALTAWQVLMQQANLQAGQQVLIHAAAGGVGHFAVQMAKQKGATVIATASDANKAFLLELGVDHFIDYKVEDFAAAAAMVDVVLDPLGGETTVKSLEVIRRGGTLVSIVGGVKENVQQAAAEKRITVKNYLVHSSGEDMQQLAKMMEEGTLKPFISKRYLLEQMADAHRQVETGKTRGKVVVNLR